MIWRRSKNRAGKRSATRHDENSPQRHGEHRGRIVGSAGVPPACRRDAGGPEILCVSVVNKFGGLRCAPPALRNYALARAGMTFVAKSSTERMASSRPIVPNAKSQTK